MRPPAAERPFVPPGDLWIGAGLFMLALIIRILFGYTHEDFTFYRLSVSGVPFSDAKGWNDLAMHIAEGNGMTGGMGAQRPLYSILLASLYTWFGPSFLLGKGINILASALLVPCVYRIGEKVFNRWIGLFLALMLTFEEGQTLFSLTLMSEPSGALLFGACVYCLLLGIEKHSKLAFLLSGALLGLSNLARPLTLLCIIPFLVCAWFLLKGDPPSYKAVSTLLICFILGLGLVLTPWIVRQKAEYGILSISDKTAESFYAATSPRLRSWTPEIEMEMLQKGIFGVKERYDYQMRAGFENLKQDPLFFITNVSAIFLSYLKDLYVTDRAFRMLVPAFIFLLFFIVPMKWGGRGKKSAMAVPGACIIAFQHFAGPFSHFITVAGLVLSLLYRKNGFPFLLAGAFVFSGATLSVGASPNLISRSLLIVGWIFEAYHLYFYYSLFLLASHRIFPGKTLSLVEAALPTISALRVRASSTEKVLRRLVKGVALCLYLFFLISGARLVALNFFLEPPPADAPPELSSSEKVRILEGVRNRLPDIIAPGEISDPASLAEYKAPSLLDERSHRKLLVAAGTITPYVYPLPGYVDLSFVARLFTPRPYDRTVVTVENVGDCVLPDRLPKHFVGRTVIVVDRLNVNPAIVHEGRVIVETIAMIPWNRETKRADAEAALIASDDTHRVLLRLLKPKQ